MGIRCEESLNINSKTRKSLRLELDYEPGLSIVCGRGTEVAEKMRKWKVDICGYKKYNGGAQELVLLRKEIIRVICAYAPQSGKPDIQKHKFYDKLVHEWYMKGTKEFTLGIKDFKGYVGKKVNEFEGIYGGNGIGEQNLNGKMLLEFCDQKGLCVANSWFK